MSQIQSITAPTRTSPAFVTWFSVFYLLIAVVSCAYLWYKTPVFSELCTSLLDFAFNILFIVVGALLWPGTLLSIACLG